jgi:hypothetical protein
LLIACAVGVLALAWLAPGAWAAWEPSPGGAAHREVEGLGRQIIEESVLGDDLGPLLTARPREAERMRQQLADRRLLLRERLGEVRDWAIAQVQRDERGRFKVTGQFFESPPLANRKRPFRSISLVFAREEGRWSLRWVGFWEIKTGTWDVLNGDSPQGEPER